MHSKKELLWTGNIQQSEQWISDSTSRGAFRHFWPFFAKKNWKSLSRMHQVCRPWEVLCLGSPEKEGSAHDHRRENVASRQNVHCRRSVTSTQKAQILETMFDNVIYTSTRDLVSSHSLQHIKHCCCPNSCTENHNEQTSIDEVMQNAKRWPYCINRKTQLSGTIVLVSP